MVIGNWLLSFFNHTHQRLTGGNRQSLKRRFRIEQHQTAAIVETLESRQMLTDFWATTQGQAILATLTEAEADYQSALSVSVQGQAAADAISQSGFQAAVSSAMQGASAAGLTADAALEVAASAALAARSSTDQLAMQAEASVESTAEAVQSAANQTAQNIYNSTASAAWAAQSADDSTSWTTYQGVMNSATATMNATQTATSAANSTAMDAAYDAYQAAQSAAAEILSGGSGSGSGGYGSGSGGYGSGSFDLNQDSTYQSAVASANATAAAAVASANAAYSSATSTAWLTYVSGEQPAYATYHAAVTANQAAYDAAEAAVQAALDSDLAANLAAYNASAASADDTKFQALIGNLAAEAGAQDSADAAYQAAVAANRATYESDSTTAYAALQSALSTYTTTANGAYAAAEAAFDDALANATTTYDAVLNDPNSSPTDIDNAWLTYSGNAGAAALTEMTDIHNASNTLYANSANVWNTYDHHSNALVAVHEASDLAEVVAKQTAINAAQHARALADTSAANTYQLQLDAYAETRALADAAAQLTFTLSLDGALAARSTADAAATNAYAHAANALEKDYTLALDDAYYAQMKATAEAYTQQMVSIATAAATAWSNWGGSSPRGAATAATDAGRAATAWSNWGGSSGNTYDHYQAAMNEASYTYNAATASIGGSASTAYFDAQKQWNQDVADGWLTYVNDKADHAQTAANAITNATQELIDTKATNLNTFATTVAPAIKAAADTILNNGLQAIQLITAAALVGVGAKLSAVAGAAGQVISAKLTANNALADHDKQRINDALAAGNVLCDAALDGVAKVVSEAPIVIRAKLDFDALLKDLVNRAGLHSETPEGKNRLYRADEDFEDSIGFDCEDYADALKRCLDGKFDKVSNVTVTFLRVSWSKIEVPNVDPDKVRRSAHGHVFLKVTKGGKFWFINPTRGYVSGPFNTQQELEAAILANANQYWDIEPESFKFKGEFADYSKLGAGEAWHKSPLMRLHLADFCDRFELDPRPFFPKEITPPKIQRYQTQPFGT